MNWIIDNKEWLFSGLGITIVTLIVGISRHLFKEKTESANNQKIGTIMSKGNVTVNQTIAKHSNLKDQIEMTFMALEQMPRKVQEAADSGATNFSFEEARIELEKLYALTRSAERTDLQLKLEKFLKNYNGYISILNDAISGKATLDEVNEFHDKKITPSRPM